MEELLDKPLFALTTREFIQILKEHLPAGPGPEEINNYAKDADKFVYGLAGIAKLFNCSKTTANRIKQSGKIDKAINQIGNIIIVDVEKAVELTGKKRNNKK
jgi:hypothetical protein